MASGRLLFQRQIQLAERVQQRAQTAAQAQQHHLRQPPHSPAAPAASCSRGLARKRQSQLRLAAGVPPQSDGASPTALRNAGKAADAARTMTAPLRSPTLEEEEEWGALRDGGWRRQLGGSA